MICKSLRIFPFKRDLTKMFVMSSDLADTKNNEKTCAGELKTIRKRFSMGYLMFLIQIKVIYYQKMKAKTIFGLRQASYT